MTLATKILTLTKSLYPTGRAFKMTGDFESLHRALAVSEAQAYGDAKAILNSVLPDNDLFDEEDASDWERRLGLVTNSLVSLADRKLAIDRKMNHPGDIKPRQNFRFLERELRAAGFDVYVYENKFDDGMGGFETRGPLVVSGGLGGVPIQHGQRQHGQRQHGQYFGQVIVNSLDNEIDLLFNIGDNLKSTFFIGGTPIGDFATIDANREIEFRQLVLRIKPVQTVAYLLINYY